VVDNRPLGIPRAFITAMSSVNAVRTIVPATTANLGPGYDSLGIALQLTNTITVQRCDDSQTLFPGIVQEAGERFFAKTGLAPFPFAWEIEGSVPQARGLGSSVTVRLGVLNGLNVLSGQLLSMQELFEMTSELEGHPDNAAPAAFGGFVVSTADGAWFRLPVDKRLRFVLLIPELEVPTALARSVLPKAVPLADAAANIGRAAAITAVFASGKYNHLKGLFRDHLHQPHRAHLIPGLDAVIAAGVRSGAMDGFLSGSGSTVACLTMVNPAGVGKAMAKAFRQHAPAGVDCRVEIVTADNRGCRIKRGRKE